MVTKKRRKAVRRAKAEKKKTIQMAPKPVQESRPVEHPVEHHVEHPVVVEHHAKKSFGAKIKAEFTTTAIVMIPIAIAINQVGRLISTSLGLPLFLDTIGTIFTAMLCGPWVAGVGGFLTNVVTAIIYGRPTSVFFGTVQLMIGLIAGLFIWKNWIKKWYMVLVFGIVIAFTSAITSAFISAGVSGGLSGTGTDIVIAYFLKTGTNFWTSIITARIITESIDKILSAFVAWISVKRLPERYAKLFKYAKNVR